jgi:thiosulfate dehydrogenase [quinone] large subunit
MISVYSDVAGRSVGRSLQGPAAFLLPVRLFIGIGWLRAFAEKALDPGWHDGRALARFLADNLQSGSEALPAYAALADAVFLPNAAVLGWIVMAGQLLTGLGILTGTLTSAALLGGLFMNLNFLLIGRPDPSAFYIVIQAALLLTGAGSVCGLDARLGRRWRNPLLVAGAELDVAGQVRARRLALFAAPIALGVALLSLRNAHDFTPGGSVKDPAMVLAVLAATAAVSALVAYLQHDAAVSSYTVVRRLSPAGRLGVAASSASPAGAPPVPSWRGDNWAPSPRAIDRSACAQGSYGLAARLEMSRDRQRVRSA